MFSAWLDWTTCFTAAVTSGLHSTAAHMLAIWTDGFSNCVLSETHFSLCHFNGSFTAEDANKPNTQKHKTGLTYARHDSTGCYVTAHSDSKATQNIQTTMTKNVILLRRVWYSLSVNLPSSDQLDCFPVVQMLKHQNVNGHSCGWCSYGGRHVRKHHKGRDTDNKTSCFHCPFLSAKGFKHATET